MVAVISDKGAESSIALHEKLGFVEVGRMGRVGFKFGRWLGTIYPAAAAQAGEEEAWVRQALRRIGGCVTSSPRSSPAWRAEMEAWIAEALAVRGETVVAVREGAGVGCHTRRREHPGNRLGGGPPAPREPPCWSGSSRSRRAPQPIVRVDASTRRVLSAHAGPTLSVRRRQAGCPTMTRRRRSTCRGDRWAAARRAATVAAARRGVPRIDLRDPEREVELRLERAGALDAEHPFFLSADERRTIRHATRCCATRRAPRRRARHARAQRPAPRERLRRGRDREIGDFGDSVISHPPPDAGAPGIRRA
jgi:hypothetical protein